MTLNRTVVAYIGHKHTDNPGWQTRHAREAANRVDNLHRMANTLYGGERQVFWAITWQRGPDSSSIYCYAVSNCLEDAFNHFLKLMNNSGISFEVLTNGQPAC